MKSHGLLFALAMTLIGAAPSFAQQGLVPAGSSNLTPGQYMLTNMNTGQALYVVIDQSGRLYAQDPRVLQIVVQTGQPGGIGQAVPGAQPGTPQQGGFGGLLKQGLQEMMKNKLTPQPAAAGAP